MDNLVVQTSKGERIIGPGQPVFVVAEMSGNHNQNFERALRIIDAAARAGADAVKLQTYTPDTITIDCDKDCFRVKEQAAWKGQTLYQLYRKACTPWDWQPKLKEYAEKKGLIVFSSPADLTAVDFLEKMQVPLYKVTSFDLVDIPLLKRIAETGKPVIMSRGMASIEEIESAVKTLKENGCPRVAILHCISAYPARIDHMNLVTIQNIAKRFNTVAGLSDHTLSRAPAVASVVLGAKIIEKHLTLRRSDGGPDAGFSSEPEELSDLVRLIRETERSLGRVCYGVGAGGEEGENVRFRKSLFAVADIKKGERFSPDNVRSIRPGQGLAPKHYDEVIGRAAAADIERGTPLAREMLAKDDAPADNFQEREWQSEYGDEYTKRNPMTAEDMEKLYLRSYGFARTSLNNQFVGDLPRAIKILEVGSHVGMQLAVLQKMGFKNLCGIEINRGAVELSKSLTKNIDIVWGKALDIPFKSGAFDLVFTSGLLVHIAPADLKRAMLEIARCAKKYIWGYELFAPSCTEIVHRGKQNTVWKANFSELYLKLCGNLRLTKEKKVRYLDSGNVNTMFLLEKF